jgi:hypothetical protein
MHWYDWLVLVFAALMCILPYIAYRLPMWMEKRHQRIDSSTS